MEKKRSNVSVQTELKFLIFIQAYQQAGLTPKQIAYWLTTLPDGEKALMAQAVKIASKRAI